jgi:hypothetical protein
MMAVSPSEQSVDHLAAGRRSHPLQALGIGFLTGFVIGGGQRSRAGQCSIGFAAQLAVRQAMITTLAEVLGTMSDISEIERDVERARDNLNRTLDAIDHKAAATSGLLLPEQEIRRYPVPSLCGALALGLAAGGARLPAVLIGVMAIGSLIVTGRRSNTEYYAGGLSHGVS